ncbi:ATP-binding cassette domain-containing protein [Streptomyces sp. L7]
MKGEVAFEDASSSTTTTRAARSSTASTSPSRPATASRSSARPAAGKSTLGYLAPRLYDRDGGRVTLDGVDVRDLDFDTLARAVESRLPGDDVPSSTPRSPTTSRFAKPDATDEELYAAARAAQIHDHIAGLPDGYDTVVGERGHRFSGGEKQRLAIARTILRDPPVLILDEATSALDNRTEAAVQDAIDAPSANRTTLTIAHRLSTIRSADQIVVLDSGHVAERGTGTKNCWNWTGGMRPSYAGTHNWNRQAEPKPTS